MCSGCWHGGLGGMPSHWGMHDLCSLGPYEWDPGVPVQHQLGTTVTGMPPAVALSSGPLCPGGMSLPIQFCFQEGLSFSNHSSMGRRSWAGLCFTSPYIRKPLSLLVECLQFVLLSPASSAFLSLAWLFGHQVSLLTAGVSTLRACGWRGQLSQERVLLAQVCPGAWVTWPSLQGFLGHSCSWAPARPDWIMGDSLCC